MENRIIKIILIFTLLFSSSNFYGHPGHGLLTEEPVHFLSSPWHLFSTVLIVGVVLFIVLRLRSTQKSLPKERD